MKDITLDVLKEAALRNIRVGKRPITLDPRVLLELIQRIEHLELGAVKPVKPYEEPKKDEE